MRGDDVKVASVGVDDGDPCVQAADREIVLPDRNGDGELGPVRRPAYPPPTSGRD
jgi:hypothetical protein